MSHWHPGQGTLALPTPPKPDPDYEGKARAELTAALAAIKAATDRPPWDYRKQRYWRTVFRQMSGWLPDAEAFDLCVDFYAELERVERLFSEQERKPNNAK